jgi:hypothetical protein
MMIAHKNIKDTVEKWYNNILIKYGYKLLRKEPKGDKCIIAVIVINHPNIDIIFQSSLIDIVKTKIMFGEVLTHSEVELLLSMKQFKMTWRELSKEF